jgi:ABC-type phosphate transport system substrate-binding protein
MNESRIPRSRQLFSSCVVITLLLVAFLGLSSLSLAASLVANADEVVVIVPAGSSVDTLSKTRLRAIFGMRSRTWAQGGAIKVFVLEDDNPVHVTFSKQVLHTFPFNLRRIWDRRVYSGTGQSPHVVKTEEEMRDKISRTENSIGYLRRNRVDAAVKEVNLQ